MTDDRRGIEETDLNPERIGTSFEAWLDEEGFADDVREAAVKELFAEQLLKAMRAKRVTKTALATTLGTSRNQLNRILDPSCDAVTLGALKKAAAAVGMRVRLELVQDDDRRGDTPAA